MLICSKAHGWMCYFEELGLQRSPKTPPLTLCPQSIKLAVPSIPCPSNHNILPYSTAMVPQEHRLESLKSYAELSSLLLNGLFNQIFFLMTNTIDIPTSVLLLVCLLRLESRPLSFLSNFSESMCQLTSHTLSQSYCDVIGRHYYFSM